MEYKPDKYRKKHRRDLFHVSSESSLSSSSKSSFHSFTYHRKRRKQTPYTNRDYLKKLFERKKLKEKSLSEKIKTPLDRKLYRTCWPIELGKISRIKKKPREKKRKKPTHRSLARKKFSKPTIYPAFGRGRSPPISCSELEFLDDESFRKVFHCINKKNFLYEQVTHQMLMSALLSPDHLKRGATIDMIVSKLRTLNMSLNPSVEEFREEILEKLLCAIKLDLVVENDGYYRIADNFLQDTLPSEKINAVWRLWYRRMTKVRS